MRAIGGTIATVRCARGCEAVEADSAQMSLFNSPGMMGYRLIVEGRHCGLPHALPRAFSLVSSTLRTLALRRQGSDLQVPHACV